MPTHLVEYTRFSHPLSLSVRKSRLRSENRVIYNTVALSAGVSTKNPMRPRNPVYAVCLSVAIVGALNAQVPLNRTPARDVGWPQLSVSNRNPNLVEGRELYSPQGLAVDNSISPPILYVSDTNNNRVMAWKNASSFAPGAPADFIIGQKDAFTTVPLFSSTGLNSPTGLAVDKNGNLYVIDAGNSRILRFPKPAAQ